MSTIAPQREPERDLQRDDAPFAGPDIAVLIAGRTRSGSLTGVVRGFRAALPDARILVFADGSGDPAALDAVRAGAAVFRSGDGMASGVQRDEALRRMFADVDADIYLVADPASSDPADASSLVNALLTERADMAVGVASRAEPGGLAGLARRFAAPLADTVSPYRALTRRFVKSFPAGASGLSVEAEMSLHARRLGVATATIDVGMWEGSFANSMEEHPHGRHGLRLLREALPAAPCLAVALLCWMAGMALTVPTLLGSVAGPNAASPVAPLAVSPPPSFFLGLVVIVAGLLAAACGLVLDGIARFRAEQKRVRFLAIPGLDRRVSRPALRAVPAHETSAA